MPRVTEALNEPSIQKSFMLAEDSRSEKAEPQLINDSSIQKEQY